jgi:3-methyladenine DNA glycosylase AlkD
MTTNQIQKETLQLISKINSPEEFIKNLHDTLRRNANPKTQREYRRIIPEMGKSFGTPLPVLRVIANKLGRYGTKKPEQVLSLLERLWTEGSFEERQIVGKAIEKIAKRHPKKCLKLISSFLKDIDNWAVCDNLACFGMEPIITQQTGEVLELCQRWIKAKDKWTRRFAVVTLRAFKRIPTTNKVFTLLDQVMQEEEPDVKKAVAWILREITKNNPEGVSKFLLKWAEQSSNNKHTRWIIREGTKKLPSSQQHKILLLLKNNYRIS